MPRIILFSRDCAKRSLDNEVDRYLQAQNMTLKNLFLIAGLVLAQNSSAMRPCPDDKKCGASPMVVFIYYAYVVCAKEFPGRFEHAKAIIDKAVDQDREGFAKLSAELGYPGKLEETMVEARRIPKAYVEEDCQKMFAKENWRP